ncbi:FAD-dependent oxidoreductase [Streptococcus oricebi]|uniref:CoA-disulfide reductase n=1 Tax=Streptococcus oricebi TaxID=1547447 RepID=A0ABS5B1R5_9STRE|nr:FAD-dependent oxidoreductase [Streptococcus oricebi]MBP2622770.1 CoA-disulfide reductase [Streptococcus oricebi]
MKIVIVGGVAGGMSAATRLRRLMEDAEIVVFDKGPYVSFANCGLPYHVSGKIEKRASLLLQSPESLHRRFRLDVFPNHEVVEIDSDKQEVVVKSDRGIFREGYDKLILSTGAEPLIPDLEGIGEAKNVYTLRTVPDLDQLIQKLSSSKNQKATVLGGGFIGLEMAENLALKGLKVTILEQAPHVLASLDPEMAVFVEEELRKNGVQVLTGHSLKAFENAGQSLLLSNGDYLESDLTLISVGVRPDSQLARKAGIKLGFRGGILVDEHYQTSIDNIYAVGDAILVKQEISKQDALISLASPANRQGRQVADVIAGLERLNAGSIGTAIVKVFNLVAAATGLNEKTLKSLQYPYKVLHISGKDHAAYYPQAKDMTLKLIFSPNDGKIYGAQVVGEKGVDKRIDVLATAIKAGLKIHDLPELELAYAPPFGSAKDPVNMLGYVASNIAEGLSQTIQWYELEEELAAGKILLDVRNPAEFKNGQFKDFMSIPLDQLRDRLAELDKEKDYILSCHSGLRSYIAERILREEGYKVKNLDGGFSLYKMVHPEKIRY